MRSKKIRQGLHWCRSCASQPTLIPKHQHQFDGFDECLVSLYSRGLGVREIQQHLLEIYKVEVSTAPPKQQHVAP